MCELEKLANKMIWKTRINSYQSFLEFLSCYWMKQLPYEVRLNNYLVWILLFESDINIGYIANDAVQASELLSEFYNSLDKLPDVLNPRIYKKTQYDFQLQNRNSLHMIYNKSTILGRRFGHVIVDDYDQYEQFSRELVPSLNPNVKIITRVNFDDVVCGGDDE